jgi:hypothetical protein
MEFTLMFQVLLVGSFMLVSIALAAKLVMEAYLNWVEVKTGIKIIQEEIQQQMEGEEDEQ